MVHEHGRTWWPGEFWTFGLVKEMVCGEAGPLGGVYLGLGVR